MPFHRRDWMLRQIEQAAAVLARILDRILRREASREEIRVDLDRAAGSLGADLELARTVDPGTLLLLVSPTGDVEPARCWIFAEAFYLDGLAAHQDGDDDAALELLGRARLLFSALAEGEFRLPGIAEAAVRIDEIDALLR